MHRCRQLDASAPCRVASSVLSSVNDYIHALGVCRCHVRLIQSFDLRPRRPLTFIYGRRVGLLIRPPDISMLEGLTIYC